MSKVAHDSDCECEGTGIVYIGGGFKTDPLGCWGKPDVQYDDEY